ncbi:hypothetical protein BC833DRAFT_98101 [Globomyces pollinis-pini]|nr:hypothetical protein BC833DRAFT_98101 [Globomyces pollinis-pini]
MPDFVTDVSVHENICGTCSEQNQPAHLVTIQFRRASLPYTFPLPLITCLWCNREFLEYTSPRKSNQPDQQTFNSVQIPVYNSRSNHASIPMDNFPNHNISGDGQDICHCKTAAVTRVVRKEGPNCGRQFYVCAKAQSDTSRCEYFKWADEQSSESRQQSGTASNSNYHGSNSGDSNINCKCNLGALSRTVRKEGPNCGRQFYVCGKSSSDDKCDFFAWAGDGANTFEVR